MAVTDKFPGDLRRVAIEIGRFLSASEGPLAIAETFQVWPITVEDLKREGGVANARFEGLWHLQLRPSPTERPRAFARVRIVDGAAEVQGVSLSPWAGAIDDIVDVVDRNYPDDSWVVRLLEVPEAHLSALWLAPVCPELEDRLIFVEGHAGGGPGWRKSEDLSRTDFQRRLQDLQPIRGIVPR